MELKLKIAGVSLFLLCLLSCQTDKSKEKSPKVAFDVPEHLSKRPTTYFIIRHGDTNGDVKDDDTELSEKGFDQAAFWGDYFSDKELDMFFTSTETYAFQTIIPIVHPYKGQVKNLEQDLSFDREFWQKTYGQRSVIVNSDELNLELTNRILQSKKYSPEQLKNDKYLLKLDIDEQRNVKDTLITF